MMYSDFYTKQSSVRIPVIVPLLLGVFALAFIILRSVPPQTTKADVKELTFVQIANVYPHQITVVWQTSTKEPGWLIYGPSESDLKSIAPDDRDELNINNKGSYNYHIATLNDLKESTRYFFSITNGKQILQNTTQSIFTVKTIATARQLNNLKPAYGKVIMPSGVPASDVIVILSARNMYPLASVSKLSGEWLIPLNYTIDKTSTTFRPLNQNESVTLYFFDTSGQESKAIAKLSQLSPLSQTIEVGKSYSLTDEEKVLAASDHNSVQTAKVDIYYPKNNTVISDARPIIKGSGIAGKQITITITNKKTQEQVFKQTKSVTNDNTWDLNLTYIFKPSTYLLTLTTKDTDDKAVTLSRTFSITKSGEQVLAAATPSGTLFPTVTATPTPSTLVLPTNTPAPTVAPTQMVLSTATPAPPVSGGGIYPLVISSIALILFGAGLLVVF